MTSDDTTALTAQIRAIIVADLQWIRPQDELTDDLPLIEDHIIDSLGLLRLVAALEAAFGIAVRDEDVVIANFGSIARIAAYVHAAQST